MNKTELLALLREERANWESFLDQIDPAIVELPGVTPLWSLKDLVAHLVGWNRKLVASLSAAVRGEPQPPPPWPAGLADENEVNAWLYDTYRARTFRDIRDESDALFAQLFTAVQQLPDDVHIETHQPTPERTYYPVQFGGREFLPFEFFDHYYDDHHADVLAWLARHSAR